MTGLLDKVTRPLGLHLPRTKSYRTGRRCTHGRRKLLKGHNAQHETYVDTLSNSTFAFYSLAFVRPTGFAVPQNPLQPLPRPKVSRSEVELNVLKVAIDGGGVYARSGPEVARRGVAKRKSSLVK